MKAALTRLRLSVPRHPECQHARGITVPRRITIRPHPLCTRVLAEAYSPCGAKLNGCPSSASRNTECVQPAGQVGVTSECLDHRQASRPQGTPSHVRIHGGQTGFSCSAPFAPSTGFALLSSGRHQHFKRPDPRRSGQPFRVTTSGLRVFGGASGCGARTVVAVDRRPRPDRTTGKTAQCSGSLEAGGARVREMDQRRLEWRPVQTEIVRKHRLKPPLIVGDSKP